MDFTKFEKKLLSLLKEDNNECIDFIENNKDSVQSYLKDKSESSYSKELTNCINTLILEETKQFNLIEQVLKHELFTDILSEFRESDIFIKACKIENINALKWLMTMDINPGVRDSNGMTALMHAAEHQSLLFVVDYFINMEKNNKFIQLIDNNGETALFHAIDNTDIFNKLLTNSQIDVNHKNDNNETIFIYSCRKDKVNIVSKLILYPECDLLCKDNKGRTGLMYLVENGRSRPFYLLQKSKQFAEMDFNYRNNNNETLISILVKQYYEAWQRENDAKKEERLTDLTMVYKALLDLGCNFNSTIDEEGNTIMNFFLMIDDIPSAFYLLSEYKDIDISIKNKDGISASFLSLFINKKYTAGRIDLKNLLMNHKTFDHFYLDPNDNNLLIHSLVREEKDYFTRLSCDIIDSSKFLNQTNNKKENAVIVGVKLGRFNYISERIINKFDLDQQNELGNTALHYAIKLKDEYAINRLCYHHANKDLKNHQEKTPMDLLMEIKSQNDNDDSNDDYNKIVDIIKNPISPEKFVSKKKSKPSINPFKKKTTDEKVNNYVKNYQIEQYSKEYEELLVRPYSPYSSLLEKMEIGSLYLSQQDLIPRFRFKF